MRQKEAKETQKERGRARGDARGSAGGTGSGEGGMTGKWLQQLPDVCERAISYKFILVTMAKILRHKKETE